jgi:hypothetical protein
LESLLVKSPSVWGGKSKGYLYKMHALVAFLIPAAISVALAVAWVLLVRTFPNLLGGAILGALDHRNAANLEKVKSELSVETSKEIEHLRADYATLRASTDYLAANQSELRAKGNIDTVALIRSYDFVISLSQRRSRPIRPSATPQVHHAPVRLTPRQAAYP